jgi:hypothetical protein
MRVAHRPSGHARPSARAITLGATVALAALAGALAGIVGTGAYAPLRVPSHAGRVAADRAMQSEAIANLEVQAAKLAAQPGPSCPQDFPALATARPLRISMFYGYDEHIGRVYDRVDARSMAQVLMSPCRGRLSTCGFSLVASAPTATRLARNLAGRRVEIGLFTSSLAGDTTRSAGLLSAYLAQRTLSRSVRERFYRELVDSDVVFYMGHSRLGGSIGFDNQTGVTTVVDAVLRRPLRPVLAALEQRPTRLKVFGMFSCNSNKYFRQAFRGANPSLALILTTAEVDYGPAEQASLGALDAVLAQSCGRAFHEAMISASDPDPTMTYLFRGQ